MIWLAIVVLLVLVVAAFELRVRQPDQLVLTEKGGQVVLRKGRFYPRHFSLSVPAVVRSISLEIPAEARGHVPVKAKVLVAVAPEPESVSALVRVGGWRKDAAEAAATAFQDSVQAVVRGLIEKYEIDALSTGELDRALRAELDKTAADFGLGVVSAHVLAVEPEDPELAEAMARREAARIREETERATQDARVAEAKARFAADEAIAETEHRLALKRLEMRAEQERREAELARVRVEEEAERRQLQLRVDREEVELLASHPELLILTPQVVRLAEASQALRNAKTVVSLGSEVTEAAPLVERLLSLLQTRRDVEAEQPQRKPDRK